MRYYLIAIAFTLILFYNQSNAQVYSYEVQLGLSAQLYNDPFKKGEPKFVGLSVFSSFMLGGSFNRMLLNYSTTLHIYQRSLGNRFNPIYSDIQIDVINSFGVGTKLFNGKIGDRFIESEGIVTPIQSYKYLKTLSFLPTYNFKHNRKGAILISTNSILNFSGRNQWVGAANITIKNFSINYLNDSGPVIRDSPFGLGIGDGFDRWWTGGGGLTIHNPRAQRLGKDWLNGFNLVEISYNMFTGYSPVLYELSKILGLTNMPNYKSSHNDGVTTTSAEFNASSYQIKFYFFENISANIGLLGSLRGTEGKYFGVQDMIHISRNDPLHPDQGTNRFFIGITNHLSSDGWQGTFTSD